jgi:hypothetical protein
MSDFILDRRNTLARCLLLALARREQAGRGHRRLLEPGRATWAQFRGNLSASALLAILAEDASLRFPLPASLAAVLGSAPRHGFDEIPEGQVAEWLGELKPALLESSRVELLAHYARSLDLPHRYAGADLHKIQATAKVLELPGTGGQLIARALERSPDAYLQVNGTVLTQSWAERAMAGLVAMECDAPDTHFVVDDPNLVWATNPEHRNTFTLVFGLSPEKGGRWDAPTLASRFPAATVVLV